MGTAMPVSYKVAAALMALYGLLSIVGGLIGYLKVGSVASLAMGVPSGIILLACTALVFQRPMGAFVGAMVVAVAVGGFFGSKVLPNVSRLGDFLHESAGPRALGMFLGGVVVIVACAVALAAMPRSTP
jgi:uncharacterized membrane protein (UPF0136 family)